MNKNLILKTDILDIIFEKRNKAYGAYNLRKYYPNRLKLALGFMLIIAAAFSAFTLLPNKDEHVITKPYEIPPPELRRIDETVKKPEKKPEVTKPVAKATPVNQKIQINRFIIVAKNEKSDTVKTILPTDVTGSKNITNANPGLVLVEPVKTDPGYGGSNLNTPKTDITTPRDADAVDVLPSYPGGMDALRKFLQKHLQTPDELEGGQSVSVRVKFVVDYTGKLKSFVTVQDVGQAYNNEVVRVLKKMPDWVPGKTKGENVSVYYVIPVRFETTD